MSNSTTPGAPAKKSWKTSLGGLIGALGTLIAFIIPWLQGSQDPRLQALGGLLMAFGFGGASLAARDKHLSDQDVGVRQEPTTKPTTDGFDPLSQPRHR